MYIDSNICYFYHLIIIVMVSYVGNRVTLAIASVTASVTESSLSQSMGK
jgi:hypothetical protein